MTTEAVTLDLTPREVLGKKVKRLRRDGIIPVHLYGRGVESRSLQCERRQLIRVLSIAGSNTPIVVTIQGEEGDQLAFAREIQWDPRRDDLIHVDFLVAEATRLVSARVPVVISGESEGARASGGTVVLQLREVDVQALPLEMPGQLELDAALLSEPDSVIRVSDLKVPSNVTVLNDSEEVVARVDIPRVAVEEEVEEGEEVAAEGDDAPEEGSEGQERP